MEREWYKSSWFLGLVAVVVIVAAVTLFKGGGNSADNGENGTPKTVDVSNEEPKAGEIAVTGSLDCMPYKENAPVEDRNCVIGLRGDDGKFYALDTSMVESIGKGIDENSTVRIIGKYSPVDPASAESSVFAYDGVLTVRVMGVK